MRLVASDGQLKSITINDGREIPRAKDGAFHVPDAVGKSMVRSGEWGVAGTTFRTARGYWCAACKFTSVFKKCGRCGADDLPESVE